MVYVASAGWVYNWHLPYGCLALNMVWGYCSARIPTQKERNTNQLISTSFSCCCSNVHWVKKCQANSAMLSSLTVNFWHVPQNFMLKTQGRFSRRAFAASGCGGIQGSSCELIVVSSLMPFSTSLVAQTSEDGPAHVSRCIPSYGDEYASLYAGTQNFQRSILYPKILI